MDAVTIQAIVVIAAAMAFNYTNGFHDAANAIATSVSTRALSPRVALGLAAIGNFIGAHLGAKVVDTVGNELVSLPQTSSGLAVVFGGVVGAVAWNLITWWFGLPSSSSHALFGGLVGATLVAGYEVLWSGIVAKVLVPMVVSPVIGLVLGFLFMVAIMWMFRNRNPRRLNRGFRIAQSISAAGMAVGHGVQDAAKTMGVVVLALYIGGLQDNTSHIPEWVFIVSALVLALGTFAGGWRIIKTLGRGVIDLGPPEGFAAETVASTVLYGSAFFGAPISTTHTITSAIMGVGATKGFAAVRWGVAGNIVAAWILTFPAAAAVAAVVYFLARPLFS